MSSAIPVSDSDSLELGSVIRPDVLWRSMDQERVGTCHPYRIEVLFELSTDCQTRAIVFVDDDEHAECPAVVGLVHDRVA